MASYNARAAIVGRKPSEKGQGYTAFIALYDVNEPHKSGKAPLSVLEFPNARNVRIVGVREVKYMLEGNDLILNDLGTIDVAEENGRVWLRVK